MEHDLAGLIDIDILHEEETRMYTCVCGSTDWIIGREHTLWEMFHVYDVS